jgi:hypothetical protein
MRALPSTAFASVLIGAIAALSAPADAACKKFGFTVNDYGKDGPTNDAKNLLDKHIAEWAAQNSVGEYSTGKKSVSCELFLDVILFDEHTCTASATVCWGPDAKKLGNSQSAASPTAPADDAGGDAPPAPVRKAHALGVAPAQAAASTPAATAATEAAAAPAAEAPAPSTAQMDAAPTQPIEQIAAPDEVPPVAAAVHATTTPPAATATPANAGATTGGVVETGALQAGQALQQAATQPAAKAPAVPEKDRAAAAAAAVSAAAAAERAAQAAETAANAAKEAAAAAVAASAASKGGATVPPLDHASGAKPVHSE